MQAVLARARFWIRETNPRQADQRYGRTVGLEGTSDARLPTVSVIVPCYNYGRFLESCVQSALDQQGVAIRVLIIDDCSTDNSAEVAHRLAGRDERVELRVHSANMGFIATFNEGVEWAQGEYVVSLDADDLLLPGALRRATTVMAEHPNVGLVYGRVLYAYEGAPLPQPSRRWRSTAVWTGSDWLEKRCHAAQNCVSMPTAVIRRAVQRTVGGYRPACRYTPDLNLWLRIAAVADIAHLRTHQAIYRVHAASMSHEPSGPLEPLRNRRAGYDSFFAEDSDTDADGRLRAMVARTLAREALWRASRMVDRGDDGQLADELVDFALDTYADARSLREWRGLQLRRRIGSGRSMIFFPFLITGAAHHLRARLGWRLLGLRGI